MHPNNIKLIITAVVVALVLGSASLFYISVPAGHVAVASLFGKVQQNVYKEGLTFPVNPLYRWTMYDVREKTHMEKAKVPSQDQLQTTIDVSVQYRIFGEKAPFILSNTGSTEDAIRVQLVPKLRSLIREQGKSIERAEDFFQETTQERLQLALVTDLSEDLLPKGILVSDVLIRDITLPPFITQAIERKKEREQEVEKQKAELERFKTEQQQKVAAAEAERNAAKAEAEMRVMLADAQAYEIEKVNEAMKENKTFLQLKALDALKAMSKDPSAKMYFINSDSPNPVPLMHIGETLNK